MIQASPIGEHLPVNEYRTPVLNLPHPPSIRTFARIMLGTRILGFLFAMLWALQSFAWWKLLIVFFTGSLVALQIQRVRVLEMRRARLR